MFSYQKSGRYFGQIAEGLEDLGKKELQELGARDIKPIYRGYYFSADKAALYRINYCSRLLSRILAPLIRFDCHSDKYLYRTAAKINWPSFLDLQKTFAVQANVSHSKITHSQYASLRLKDAIVDVFREKPANAPMWIPEIRIFCSTFIFRITRPQFISIPQALPCTGGAIALNQSLLPCRRQ